MSAEPLAWGAVGLFGAFLAYRAIRKRREASGGHGAPGAASLAALAAVRDANEAFPSRSRASDGIMGDARHQAGTSDHNTGNAFDLTHDPASGATGDLFARLALDDPRVSYVIWNRRIYNRLRGETWEGGGRPYAGENQHTHHAHVSIRPEARDDDSAWGWAP